MSVLGFLDTKTILQECIHVQKGVLLIIAPTGTGKTMGMRDLVVRHQDVYGNTFMVQPTKMASCSVEGIVTMTPLQLILHFLKHKRFVCDTLVMDEVHTQSVEYHTILSILQKTECYQQMRVVLMSATPHVQFLSSFFPFRTYHSPIMSPFSIDIHYEPLDFYGFASYSHMARHVLFLLKKYPQHKRVLVFLYTHEQCDKMALEFKEYAKTYNQGEVYALYGGVDMLEWQDFLQNHDRFLVFSTNVAETSITIPDLSLVIDFGIRCVQRNNRIIYNHCPKTNLVQRSGRTGRTCHGVVIRCMSEQDFNSRPEKDNPEYNWDMIVLHIVHHHHDPATLLPSEVHVENILRKFRFYHLIKESGNLDKQLVSFIMRCPLLLKNCCHLWQMMRRNNHPKFVLYLLSCAIIDQMELRMSRIYYYSNEMKFTKRRLLDRLKRIFSGNNDDEITLYMNIVLSCMLYEKPVMFSNAFSLNFRFLRQISTAMTRLWEFVFPHTKQTWMDAVRSHLSHKTEQDMERKNFYKILSLSDSSMEYVRTCFLMNPMVPKFLLANDLMLRPNFIIEHYNCMISILNFYSQNRCMFLLSYDDTEIDKWFDPTTPLEDITTLSFTLYSFYPRRMDNSMKLNTSMIKQTCFQMNAIKKKKDVVRRLFQNVLEDIEEDVAYRPNFWKMEESIQSFLNHVSNFLK